MNKVESRVIELGKRVIRMTTDQLGGITYAYLEDDPVRTFDWQAPEARSSSQLLTFEAKAINPGIVIHRIDPAIAHSQATEVDPVTYGTATLIK